MTPSTFVHIMALVCVAIGGAEACLRSEWHIAYIAFGVVIAALTVPPNRRVKAAP